MLGSGIQAAPFVNVYTLLLDSDLAPVYHGISVSNPKPPTNPQQPDAIMLMLAGHPPSPAAEHWLLGGCLRPVGLYFLGV